MQKKAQRRKGSEEEEEEQREEKSAAPEETGREGEGAEEESAENSFDALVSPLTPCSSHSASPKSSSSSRSSSIVSSTSKRKHPKRQPNSKRNTKRKGKPQGKPKGKTEGKPKGKQQEKPKGEGMGKRKARSNGEEREGNKVKELAERANLIAQLDCLPLYFQWTRDEPSEIGVQEALCTLPVKKSIGKAPPRNLALRKMLEKRLKLKNCRKPLRKEEVRKGEEAKEGEKTTSRVRKRCKGPLKTP